MARMDDKPDQNPYGAPQESPSPRDFRGAMVWLLAIALATSPFLLVGVAAVGVILHLLSAFGLVP
jgi:hypothetical protein